MCLYPNLIKNRRFTANKKNGGVVPPILDNRTMYVAIGCQRCMECRRRKARDWQVRMLEEIKTAKNGVFVTLTFSDESISELAEGEDEYVGYELDNRIATKAARLFFENWRKEYGKSVRHWLVTELGGGDTLKGHKGTENIHLHGIIWTDKPQEIRRKWKFGYTWLGEYVNGATVNYVTKYVSKIDIKHENYKSKVLASAGIGAGYIESIRSRDNKYKEGNTDEGYRTSTGHKMGLPIYYRNKIYSDAEREALWIEKLNKEERWVDGNRVDIRLKNNEYMRAVRTARKKNKKLGYGSDEKEWDKIKYEEAMREMMNLTRINRGRDKKKKKEQGAAE